MKKLQPYSEDIVKAHRKVCQTIVKTKLDAVENKLVCPCQKRYVQAIRQFIEEEDGFVADAGKIRDMVGRVEQVFFFRQENIPDMYVSLNTELEEKVFRYDYFRDGKIKGTEGHANSVMREFVKRVKVCPYCNADSVYALEVNERDKPYKSAFDHFYPKSRYPFLGLSLYNLIPSCHRCNSTFKQDRYAETLATYHPYVDDLDEASRFVLIGLTNRMIQGQETSDEMKIRLRSLTKDGQPHQVRTKELENYQKLFCIDDVYSTLFSDEALRVLQQGRVINKGYMADVKRLLPGVDPWQLMFGTPLDRSQIDRHWLSKLKLDVLEGYCGVTVPKGEK